MKLTMVGIVLLSLLSVTIPAATHAGEIVAPKDGADARHHRNSQRDIATGTADINRGNQVNQNSQRDIAAANADINRGNQLNQNSQRAIATGNAEINRGNQLNQNGRRDLGDANADISRGNQLNQNGRRDLSDANADISRGNQLNQNAQAPWRLPRPRYDWKVNLHRPRSLGTESYHHHRVHGV